MKEQILILLEIHHEARTLTSTAETNPREECLAVGKASYTDYCRCCFERLLQCLACESSYLIALHRICIPCKPDSVPLPSF